MKMINGRLPTWYVIKRISADPELYAKAPKTPELYAEKVEHESHGDVLCYVLFQADWTVDRSGYVDNRSDWTLYRRGKKKRKAKMGEVKLGRVISSDDETIGNSEIESAIEDLRGAYDIIAIPVKS